MKIAKIETDYIQIPLARPFKTALRTVESVHDLVVRITADTGEVGYGEAPPTAVITGDTLGSIRCAIEEFIAPSLMGMDVEDLDGIMAKLHSCILKNTSAKAAVDMAVYDLYAKQLGRPLYKVLGGRRNSLETDLTISVNPVEEMVADSLDAVAQGYRILKVKVGKEEYPVTAIAAGAFKGKKELRKVIIGANVTRIGKKAFQGCQSLKKLVIKSKKLKKIGAKAFRNSNPALKIKVPGGRKKAYRKLI